MHVVGAFFFFLLPAIDTVFCFLPCLLGVCSLDFVLAACSFLLVASCSLLYVSCSTSSFMIFLCFAKSVNIIFTIISTIATNISVTALLFVRYHHSCQSYQYSHSFHCYHCHYPYDCRKLFHDCRYFHYVLYPCWY